MKLPLAHSFGDVRGLLQQEPSAPAWSLLCALLDTWPQTAEDEDELEGVVLPYVLQHTARWPAELRCADARRARLERACRAAHRVELYHQTPARLRTLAGEPLEAMRALELRALELGELGGWGALAQVEELRTDLREGAARQVRQMQALRCLHLMGDPPDGLLEQLPALEELGLGSSPALLKALAGMRLERLERLVFRFHKRQESLMWGWLKHEAPTLRSLSMDGLETRARELVGVVRPGLERLSLTNATIPYQDWTASLTPAADTLTHLTLWASLFQSAPDQLAALALPALRHVTLIAPRLDAKRLDALLGAPWMRQLETLSISGQELSAHAFRQLTAPDLTALSLLDCALTPEALGVLLEPGRLPALRKLRLTDLPLADRDTQLLTTTQTSLQLKELRLTSCRITPEQVATLGRADFTRLDTLDLTACPLDTAHIEALHRAPLTARLSVLELDAPRVAASARLRDDATLAPLVRWAIQGVLSV